MHPAGGFCIIEDVIFIIQKVPHSKYAVRDEFSSRGSTLLNLIINKIRFTSFSTITESPGCIKAAQRWFSFSFQSRMLPAKYIPLCGIRKGLLSSSTHLPYLVSSTRIIIACRIILSTVFRKFIYKCPFSVYIRTISCV